MVDSKTCSHLVYSYLFTLCTTIPVLFLVYSSLPLGIFRVIPFTQFLSYYPFPPLPKHIVPFLLLIDMYQLSEFCKRHAYRYLNHTAFTEKATRSFLYHMQLHPMTGNSMVRCVVRASESSWKLFVFTAKGRVGA
jgi:hypothetical protein